MIPYNGTSHKDRCHLSPTFSSLCQIMYLDTFVVFTILEILSSGLLMFWEPGVIDEHQNKYKVKCIQKAEMNNIFSFQKSLLL